MGSCGTGGPRVPRSHGGPEGPSGPGVPRLGPFFLPCHTQVLISSFMNKFVTLVKVKNDKDINGLRKLIDQAESSIQNLSSLDVATDRYGTLLVPFINDKLRDNIPISIAKKV